MNIPFLRLVEYRDDGHYVYQCLHCGEKIDVGEWKFDPKYCCWCGVEYKGHILEKKLYHVWNTHKSGKLWFHVEWAYDWGDGDEPLWEKDWRKSDSPKVIIQYLKDAKAEKAEENDRLERGEWLFRVGVSKKEDYSTCTKIDVDEYCRRTGKKFNKKEYERI